MAARVKRIFCLILGHRWQLKWDGVRAVDASSRIGYYRHCERCHATARGAVGRGSR